MAAVRRTCRRLGRIVTAFWFVDPIMTGRLIPSREGRDGEAKV
jgi:hypothetical protein